jgi:hypothetical protein
MVTKIALIAASKFVESNYNELTFGQFTDVIHRNKPYKRLFAFSSMIDGYPFDHVFADEAELDAWFLYVPPTISKFQASKQLRAMGKYQDLMAELDKDTTGNAKIDWMDAQNLARNHELVLGMAYVLGLTDEQLDDFFVAANQF